MEFNASRSPRPFRLLPEIFPSVERMVYRGRQENDLPRLLSYPDATGTARWHQLQTIALKSTPKEFALLTDGEVQASMTNKMAVGLASPHVVFRPSRLAHPWDDDANCPDVQEYLAVLDDAEASR